MKKEIGSDVGSKDGCEIASEHEVEIESGNWESEVEMEWKLKVEIENGNCGKIDYFP